MSIQQALNNMLFSAQFGAGLYAQSPAGKAQAEVNKLTKQKSHLEKEKTQVLKGLEPYKDSEFGKTQIMRAEAGYAEKFENLALDIYKTKSTERAFKNLQEAVAEKTEKQKAYKDRKKFLKEQEKAKEKGGNK